MVRMPHWPIPQLLFPTRNDLSVMANLMDKLGNPHLKIPPVIHVAGTNGKGSSVAYLKSSLEAAGYKVHAYTSPHLLEYNERIILAGDQILDDYLFLPSF
jgi:dihydrofolate synthase/folylpolyglutamate synthase